VLALALLVATGPVIVDGRHEPPALRAAGGAAFGAVAGASVGVAVAIGVGLAVGPGPVCYRPAMSMSMQTSMAVFPSCSDTNNGLDDALYSAAVAVPIGVVVGATIGGFAMVNAVDPETSPPLEHAY
jgi:hypothetical protein